MAGYPHLTLPMGHVDGLPIGLSLISTAKTDERLLALGQTIEQLTQARLSPAL